MIVGIANIAGKKCCACCCGFCRYESLCVSWSWTGGGVVGCSGANTSPQQFEVPFQSAVGPCSNGIGDSTGTYHGFTSSTLSNQAEFTITPNGSTTPAFPCRLTLRAAFLCSSVSPGLAVYQGPVAMSGGESAYPGGECRPIPSGGLTVTLGAIGDPSQPTVTFVIKPGPCGVGVTAPLLSAQTAMASTSERRSLPCVSLGERIEYQAGCSSGWMCRHACTSSRPDVLSHLGGVSEAVPGDDCQTCPGYAARE